MALRLTTSRLAATLVVVAVLFSAGSAWAGCADDMAAFKRGDLATALKEFRPLAEQGVADAQFSLALMYDNGEGVPTHYVKAYMWFSLAQAQGITPTADNLDIVKKQMTPAQITKAQELAAEWCEQRIAISKKSSRRSNYGVAGLIKF